MANQNVVSMKALLEAGVHFGHQTRRWNPKMAPYIYTERNGIYIIDLQKTVKKLEEAYAFVRQLSENGQSLLFVGTKKQAQEAIKDEATRCGMYYVNARWLGGMMTNFKTMRTRIDRLNQLKTMQADGTFDMLPKKEVIKHQGEIAKLEKYLGGEELTIDEIKTCIRKSTIANKMVPVCCGTSYRNKGVQQLLDAIVDYMPAPTDVPSIKGTNPETGEEEFRHSSDSEPFAALAFKIATDPFVGKLCFFRVYSGTVTTGSTVYNATKDLSLIHI